jgi:hypothetical protein
MAKKAELTTFNAKDGKHDRSRDRHESKDRSSKKESNR